MSVKTSRAQHDGFGVGDWRNRVLAYPKFKLSTEEQQELLADFLPYCTTVRMPAKLPATPTCRDKFNLPLLQLVVVGKADYLVNGDQDLLSLAESLTAEFGRGFDASNLRYMRLFYLAFPIRDALRRELSWTHYRTLLRVEDEQARRWYMNETAAQSWSSRALERQIGTLYYERLLASRDREPVEAEAQANTGTMGTLREFVRDIIRQ